MLNSATITANLPAADLGRARAFYADKLGLTASQELEGVMLVYRTAGGSTFSIYQTDYAGQAGHTLAQWHVDDVDAAVGDLKSKGVAFEHYDACRVSSGTTTLHRWERWVRRRGLKTARTTSSASMTAFRKRGPVSTPRSVANQDTDVSRRIGRGGWRA